MLIQVNMSSLHVFSSFIFHQSINSQQIFPLLCNLLLSWSVLANFYRVSLTVHLYLLTNLTTSYQFSSPYHSHNFSSHLSSLIILLMLLSGQKNVSPQFHLDTSTCHTLPYQLPITITISLMLLSSYYCIHYPLLTLCSPMPMHSPESYFQE
jgi:hypothetical protein